MTNTTMKITKRTFDILKNFSTINSNILIEPGNRITTISATKSILVEAEIDEEFETRFGIWDLNKFLGTISLFTDPEFEFSDKFVTIFGSNNSSVKYFYSEPKLLTTSAKKINMPEVAFSFNITGKQISEMYKAASVLQLPDVCIRSVDGKIMLVAEDKTDSTSNNFCIDVNEETNSEFEMYLKMENLKLYPGDYKVDVCQKVVSRFTNTSSSKDFVYWIALESDSTYKA
jgi:hypothetical protein